MVLIVGPAFSGKREYARSLGFSEADMADARLDSRPVIYNVQDMVAPDPAGALELLEPLCQKRALIINECGSGVIPANRAEREWREASGRLAIALAERAERVVRVVCGLTVTLK